MLRVTRDTGRRRLRAPHAQYAQHRVRTYIQLGVPAPGGPGGRSQSAAQATLACRESWAGRRYSNGPVQRALGVAYARDHGSHGSKVKVHGSEVTGGVPRRMGEVGLLWLLAMGRGRRDGRGRQGLAAPENTRLWSEKRPGRLMRIGQGCGFGKCRQPSCAAGS